MKEIGRSDSLGIVKKKSSSGCLIIKRKIPPTDNNKNNGEIGGSSRNYINFIEKKRPRVVVKSDNDESSDEEPQFRRKTDKYSYNDGSSGFSNVSGFRESRELDKEKSRIDGFNERRVKEDVRFNPHWRNEEQMDSGFASGSGSGMKIYDKRRDFVYENNSDVGLGGRSSRVSHYGMTEGDEPRLPASGEKYREVSDKPIRLQGKNGVLKVMVKKNKPMNVLNHGYDHVKAEDRTDAGPMIYRKGQLIYKNHDPLEAYSKKTLAMGSSVSSASKHHGYDHVKEEDTTEAGPVIYRKGQLIYKNNGTLIKKTIATGSSVSSASKHVYLSRKSDMELMNKDNDAVLPLKSSGVQHSVIEKPVASEKRVSPQTKNVTPVKGKETKVKRGIGTEKQKLREKIRSMLLGAGWTIDYRPRRNRDYQDAVYINPSGTAYWSIIKAYEALQKEEKDHSQDAGDFTPLPVETLSKLTRQTRKKIEREMKRKKREEGRSAVAAETSKRRLEEASHDTGDDSNDDLYNKAAKKRNIGDNSHVIHARKTNKLGRCTLLIRSEGKKSGDDQFVPDSGKRTLLSWLIDSGTVQMNETVQYMNERKIRIMQEGRITKEGIHCGCCNQILTVTKFELHAGSKLCQPFLNIFVQSGKSLMQCLIDAWNKQGELERRGFHGVDVNGDDPNDDTCGLCADGGDLICCDGCPSTFHQSCLGIKMLPQGDWHCPNCSCKYCGMANTSFRAESPLFVCHLCEKKYHKLCSTQMDRKPIDLNDPMLSFCGAKCLQLHSQLQKLLGVKHELDSGLSWSLIHRSDISSDTFSSIELSQRVECNSKLAVALSVIDECFLPVVDRRSGINLIHNVVYSCGSNLSRLNYSGFFTAILERDEELICAASIRIHGTQLAEMPLIGTRHIYRRQGMCHQLLSAIESALSSLGVEKLIIPALAEHMHTWAGVFGFKPLEDSHRQELRSMNMLVFPGTDMLQKPLVVEKGSRLHKTSIEMEKSDQNPSDYIEATEKIYPANSDSQAPPKVPLNDSISSSESDTPLPVLSIKSEVLLNSAEQLDGDDTILQNPEACTESLAHSDSTEARNEHDAILAKSVVEDGNESTDNTANADSKAGELPMQNGNVLSTPKTNGANSNPLQDPDIILRDTETADKSVLPIESVSLDARSDANVEVFTAKIAEKESISVSTDLDSNLQATDVQNGKISDGISSETDVQDGNEANDEVANVDSKVDFAVQHGNVLCTAKKSDANFIPPQDPDMILHDAETADKSVLPKESVSLDARSGANVEVLMAKTAEKESIFVSTDLDSNCQATDAQNDKISDGIPTGTDVQVGSEANDEVANADSKVGLAVQHGNVISTTRSTDANSILLPDTGTADNPLSPKEVVSLDAGSDSNVDVFVTKTAEKDSFSTPENLNSNMQITEVQNEKIADGIAAKTGVENGNETGDKIANSDSDGITERTGVEDGNETGDKIANTDSKVEGFAVQNGNVTSTTRAVDANSFLLPDTGTADNLLPKDSVFQDARSHSNVDVFMAETAEKESVSVSADLDSSIQVTDVQNSKIVDVISLEYNSQNDVISPKPQSPGLDPHLAAESKFSTGV
uniref:uncharacterized protein LOC122595110 n=1 Tax=Erigeron canadensis TaxID=72917 RepID=UPI001CB96813|nr:uncharacterized protein LOC122595110 [Erigeron canadensis]